MTTVRAAVTEALSANSFLTIGRSLDASGLQTTTSWPLRELLASWDAVCARLTVRPAGSGTRRAPLAACRSRPRP